MSTAVTGAGPSQAQAAKHSAASVEWYTPPEIVERARAVMGSIHLDPASCAKANSIVKADHYWSGVGAPADIFWLGNVFLNPPGGCYDKAGNVVKNGRSAAKTWWLKLVNEYMAGNVNQAIFVGFNLDCLQNTQGQGQGRAVTDYPICFPEKRIRFLHGETLEPCSQPTHANVIVYLPPVTSVAVYDRSRGVFQQVFSSLGTVRL